MKRNTPLKVRQTNPNFKDKLTLRLLSNDSKNEKSIQVGNEWVTIQGDTSLVPFIDTPYGEEHAVLEYQVGNESATNPLPIYKQQGSVSQFLVHGINLMESMRYFKGEFSIICT